MVLVCLLVLSSCDNPNSNFTDVGVSHYRSSKGLEENASRLDLALFEQEGVFMKCTNSNISFLRDTSLIYLTDKDGEGFNKLYVINANMGYYPYSHPLEIWESYILVSTNDKKSYQASFAWADSSGAIDYDYRVILDRSSLSYQLIKTNNNASSYRNRTDTVRGTCKQRVGFPIKLRTLIRETNDRAEELRLEYEKDKERTEKRNKI